VRRPTVRSWPYTTRFRSHLQARGGQDQAMANLDEAGAALRALADGQAALVWVDLPSLQPPWKVDPEILAHYFPEEARISGTIFRSEEHTSELQSRVDLVC